MKTRQEALDYGLSFPNTYQEAPFHDPNWQLIRVKDSKKVFLWTYERNGFINLNVKVSPAWRDFWRDAFPSVIPGWHQNKDNWNTIILDGSIPDDAIKNMIADSYDIGRDEGRTLGKCNLYVFDGYAPILMIKSDDTLVFVNSKEDGEIEKLYVELSQ